MKYLLGAGIGAAIGYAMAKPNSQGGNAEQTIAIGSAIGALAAYFLF